MVIEACVCNWGIRGVEHLPAHSHRAWAHVLYNDRELTIPQHDVELNPGIVVLDQGEDIRVWVDWKAVAR